MKVKVSGHGRKVGAIGITHPFTVTVEADTVEEARLKTYEHFESLSGLRFKGIEDPLLGKDGGKLSGWPSYGTGKLS